MRSGGVNVIGMVSGNLGLGVAARHLVTAMLRKGIEVAAFDINPGGGRQGYSMEYADITVQDASDLPHDVSIFILPPPMIGSAIARFSGLFERSSVTTVACVYWELPVLPKRWIRLLEAFDVAVGMSGFIEATLARHLSGVDVLRGLQPIYFDMAALADRRRFSIPESDYVFICGFDPFSDLARKNPMAAVDAFRRAFPSRRDVRLIIKMNVASSSEHGKRVLKELVAPVRELARGDQRIQLIEETLPHKELMSLYASADAYVSLHRAEGLGLNMLEAMGLGKPVVATGWSGNMSFMSATNACCVRYRLVPVVARSEHYSRMLKGTSAYWAEPDLDDAAFWMRRLAEDRAVGVGIGARAREAFSCYQREAAEIGFLGEVLAVREHRLSCRKRGDYLVDAERQARVRECVEEAQRRKRGPWRRRFATSAARQFDRFIGWRLKARERG